VRLDLDDLLAGGDDDQPGVFCNQCPQQSSHAAILQASV